MKHLSAILALLALPLLAGEAVGNTPQRAEHLLRLLAHPRHVFQHPAGIRAQFLGDVLNPDFGHSLNAPPYICLIILHLNSIMPTAFGVWSLE